MRPWKTQLEVLCRALPVKDRALHHAVASRGICGCYQVPATELTDGGPEPPSSHARRPQDIDEPIAVLRKIRVPAGGQASPGVPRRRGKQRMDSEITLDGVSAASATPSLNVGDGPGPSLACPESHKAAVTHDARVAGVSGKGLEGSSTLGDVGGGKELSMSLLPKPGFQDCSAASEGNQSPSQRKRPRELMSGVNGQGACLRDCCLVCPRLLAC